MKKFLSYLAAAMCLLGQPVFSQTEKETPELGLPGDNLDLYAVLDLFQKSKTIEEFEKSLNEQKTGINNLDLDLDKKVDFIKIVTTKKDLSYTFVLQIAVSEKETQDVAVILVDKDATSGKVTLQIVGDKELYGKDYVVEPRTTGESVTANPAYVGADPVTKDVPATQTVVVVEQAPIVQYVYSPAYVPYYPPYYYGYYPPYFAAFTVMAVGIYRHNHYHYHGSGHYHNTTVVHNHNNYNNYNGNRNSSDRVSHNNASGRYNSGNASNRASASTRESGASNRGGSGNSASTRPSNSNMSSSNRSSGSSASSRPSSSNMSSSNRSSGSSAASRSSSSRSSSSMSGGGGRSRGGGGGGGFSGGGGGGGGRRR